MNTPVTALVGVTAYKRTSATITCARKNEPRKGEQNYGKNKNGNKNY